MAKFLHIDIETYSPVSLPDCGLYKYANESRILLVAYAFENEPVQIIDIAQGEELPQWFIDALQDPDILKIAHNAAFERVNFTFALWTDLSHQWLDPMQWYCTMGACARCGLPLGLADAAKALKLEQQKMTEGKKLIQMFCVPGKKSLTNPEGKPCSPADYPEQWATFKRYCIKDVEVEREIFKATCWYPYLSAEHDTYAADQRINDRGVLLDQDLARNAARMDAIHKGRLNEELKALTGLENPNSVPQLKAWLEERTGRHFDSLDKTVVADLLKTEKDPVVIEALKARAQTGKTSTGKFATMLDWVCPDGRLHGILQYYGSRTGRWAGRGPQLHNLPRNSCPSLDAARRLLKEDDYVGLQLNYGNVPDILSQLVRTALVAPPGKTFAVCDFSAIEARVLAWLAGEDWVLDVFRSGGDIYCSTASAMFHVPVEKHGRNAELRQKGKIAVLALGYQGGVGALDAMGGQRMGLTADEEAEIVKRWRTANPNIVQLWGAIEAAAKRCITYKEHVACRPEKSNHSFGFDFFQGNLLITLPSGRALCYPEAKITSSGTIGFKGTSANSVWTDLETFGGKLVENITQAVARDCLAEVIRRLEGLGLQTVFHVHDEVIVEVDAGIAAFELERIEQAFSLSPKWALGLPLSGAGYLTGYYKKD